MYGGCGGGGGGGQDGRWLFVRLVGNCGPFGKKNCQVEVIEL